MPLSPLFKRNQVSFPHKSSRYQTELSLYACMRAENFREILCTKYLFFQTNIIMQLPFKAMANDPIRGRADAGRAPLPVGSNQGPVMR